MDSKPLLEKTIYNTIDNIGDFFADNFSKIDGFQYQWSSLITNNPLLFEDIDYLRVKQYIKNTVTDEEIELYKKGEIRELYATFENMLVCNLQYYDRIMSFCTMIFLRFVRLSENECTSQHLSDIVLQLELTPTKIWCAALSNQSSKLKEIEYGWSLNSNLHLIDYRNDKSHIENNWEILYNINYFSKFIEYCALRNGTTGFRTTFLADKTPNRKLAKVCTKFTNATIAVAEDSLISVHDYIMENELMTQKLYTSLYNILLKMYNNDTTKFAVYVFNRDFFIQTVKFSMKVSKDDVGRITKDYLANSYECFVAEEYLFKSIHAQLEWAKYSTPLKFETEKTILINLLIQMLNDDYKNIVCLKRMNEYGVLAKINFSGMFDKVNIDESYMFNNRTIRKTRITMSKENAAKFVVNNLGYYIFGIEQDVLNLPVNIDTQTLIDHYSKYCTPIMKHMQHAIVLHNFSKNDIIDVLCNGKINPEKINNKNIKFTNIKSTLNPKSIMNLMENKNGKNELEKKNYWEIVNN